MDNNINDNEQQKIDLSDIIKSQKPQEKKSHIKTVLALLLVACLLTGFLTWYILPKAFVSARLSEPKGSVYVEYEGKEIPAKNNLLLSNRDYIQTQDENSSAKLILDNNKRVYISGSTSLSLEMIPQREDSDITISLSRGSVTTVSYPSNSKTGSLVITTPNTTINVLGESVRVSVYEGEGDIYYTRISSFSGYQEIYLNGEDYETNVSSDSPFPKNQRIEKEGCEYIIYTDLSRNETQFVRFEADGTNPMPRHGLYSRDIDYDTIPNDVLLFMESCIGDNFSFGGISKGKIKAYSLEESLPDPQMDMALKAKSDEAYDLENKTASLENSVEDSYNNDNEIYPEVSVFASITFIEDPEDTTTTLD